MPETVIFSGLLVDGGARRGLLRPLPLALQSRDGGLERLDATVLRQYQPCITGLTRACVYHFAIGLGHLRGLHRSIRGKLAEIKWHCHVFHCSIVTLLLETTTCCARRPLAVAFGFLPP